MVRRVDPPHRWATALLAGAWLLSWAVVASSQGCGAEEARSSLGGGGAGGTAPACVGVTPPASAWGAEPGPINHPPGTGGSAEGGAGVGGLAQGGASVGGAGGLAAGGSGGEGTAGTGGGPELPIPPGAEAPSWWLEDRQPKSCGYQATYGLDLFRGQVTVVALWAGS